MLSLHSIPLPILRQMILFKKKVDLRNWLDARQKKGYKINFVPTMGALHAGHISLIELSKQQDAITICSIFVNPAQFNDQKDFEKYPATLENDIYLLEKSGCDMLFLPSVKEIYPDGISQKINYDIGYLETILEGKYRPGHFQGVCMVMHRLLEIVKPDRLYLGQKDFQQSMIIKRLTRLIGMAELIEVIIFPTIREKNGLAMSSRNMRLSEEGREKAGAIYRSLNLIKQNISKKNFAELKNEAKMMIGENGLKVDYIEIADAKDLSLVNEWDNKKKLIALAAATINEVRLIDNILLN
jgi:pantoate--beta-alanine ligase